MKYNYLLLLGLVGCCTTATVADYPPETIVAVIPKIEPHKYSVGQCFQVFDPQTGKTNPADIVRVESISPTSYVYRWRVYQSEWALDTNMGIGRFELLESMTKEVKCPGG
jgi:hypothetical protein